jgi:aspartate carbamoyltransferase catalytic subunit
LSRLDGRHLIDVGDGNAHHPDQAHVLDILSGLKAGDSNSTASR